jgi:ADP-heptose:LPS heptosyltransferase
MKKYFMKIFDIILPFILQFSGKGKNKKHVEKIVILSLHKLGDAVFTISAIKNIINFHSDKKVLLVCFKDTSEIYKLVFNTLEYGILVRKNFYFNGRIGGFRARDMIKRENADRIYDITGDISSASLLFNCGAREIIGINEIKYKSLYDIYSQISNGPHMSDIYLNAIKPVINISKEQINIVSAPPLSSEYILIHPFAGWKAKEWEFDKFLKLTQKLSAKIEVRIIIPGGFLTTNKIEILRKKFIIVETNNILELIECIKSCLLLIGNDSGPVHIANLLGKPVFTIYGPTNPSFHQPKSGLSHYVVKKISCSPKINEKLCYTNGGRMGCRSFECMIQMRVDDVVSEVTKLLNIISKGTDARYKHSI